MSSTTIIIKAFDELGVTKEKFAQLVFGTLVIEDIAGIFMMVILSTVSVSRNISGGALALQIGMLVLYLAIMLRYSVVLTLICVCSIAVNIALKWVNHQTPFADILKGL